MVCAAGRGGQEMFVSVKGDQRGFPGNQCLGLWASTAEGLDLIPGQGTIHRSHILQPKGWECLGQDSAAKQMINIFKISSLL